MKLAEIGRENISSVKVGVHQNSLISSSEYNCMLFLCVYYSLYGYSISGTDLGHFIDRSVDVGHEVSNGRLDVVGQDFKLVEESHGHGDQRFLGPLKSKDIR